ncbi:MAG TPA: hypothetical protein VML75_24330, partial [Kofleriaceae bacterium]|nr:hypothetical protein [Kofleriaceae bacterium]
MRYLPIYAIVLIAACSGKHGAGTAPAPDPCANGREQLVEAVRLRDDGHLGRALREVEAVEPSCAAAGGRLLRA